MPYCGDFSGKNPDESICYLADNKNFPYGPREKEELTSILNALVEKLLKKINPKLIVLACNTATITSLAHLRENFPEIPFVGTVPAVKPALESGENGKIGVLGTERTIKEINNLNLANETRGIFGIAAPELVDFIESRINSSSEKEKTAIVNKYIEIFKSANIKTLVLGCTHFLFLLEEFRRAAYPSIGIFDSLAGITKRVERLLDENDKALRAEKNTLPEYQLIITKNEADSALWRTRAKSAGFNLAFIN